MHSIECRRERGSRPFFSFLQFRHPSTLLVSLTEPSKNRECPRDRLAKRIKNFSWLARAWQKGLEMGVIVSRSSPSPFLFFLHGKNSVLCGSIDTFLSGFLLASQTFTNFVMASFPLLCPRASLAYGTSKVAQDRKATFFGSYSQRFGLDRLGWTFYGRPEEGAVKTAKKTNSPSFSPGSWSGRNPRFLLLYYALRVGLMSGEVEIHKQLYIRVPWTVVCLRGAIIVRFPQGKK